MKIEKATCYSFHLNREESLAHLRLIGPLRQAGISIINGIKDDQVLVGRVSEGDIVIIQRDFPKRFDDYKKIIETAHKEGKPVVFDLDDLLFILPEDHPGRQMQYYATSLLPMFQAMTEADLITVSTPKLRDVVGKYHDNVVVLPNYFDDTLWQLKPPVQKKLENEVLTIGYMGGFPHKPDVEYLAPVFQELIERYPHRIRFHFWGLEPPEEIRSFSQVTSTLSYCYSYRDFATFFQTQSADILLAPLVDNLFNRCKSPVKFFEYSALGAPGVYSRLETYGEVVTHGKNGLLASSLEEWSESIIQLVENDELRFELASNAQATIRAGWLLSQNGFRWQETYRNLTEVSLHTAHESQGDIVQSINTQLSEMFTRKETEIQSLTMQVAERESKVQTLTKLVADREHTIQGVTEEKNRAEVEATHYAMSKSWRITRPLRKIMGKIRRVR
jgi:processive 1,2-diacylglycerol beta-glucosyltransferase